MEKLLNLLKSEWDVISAAPITILGLVLLIWGAVWLQYRQRLDAVKELLEIKNSRLAEFQSKTNAQTPDEAADRIAELEKRIEEIATQPAKWG